MPGFGEKTGCFCRYGSRLAGRLPRPGFGARFRSKSMTIRFIFRQSHHQICDILTRSLTSGKKPIDKNSRLEIPKKTAEPFSSTHPQLAEAQASASLSSASFCSFRAFGLRCVIFLRAGLHFWTSRTCGAGPGVRNFLFGVTLSVGFQSVEFRLSLAQLRRRAVADTHRAGRRHRNTSGINLQFDRRALFAGYFVNDARHEALPSD